MLIHFDETQLGRLGRFIIDCQSKFISVHGDLNNRFHKFGDTFEADIHISRNVNSKILGKSLIQINKRTRYSMNDSLYLCYGQSVKAYKMLHTFHCSR